MFRMLITTEAYEALEQLIWAVDRESENVVQRKLGLLVHLYEESEQRRRQFIKGLYDRIRNKDKRALIEILQTVGEPGRYEIVYARDWSNLLRALYDAGVMTEEQCLEYINKINEIITGMTESGDNTNA